MVSAGVVPGYGCQYGQGSLGEEATLIVQRAPPGIERNYMGRQGVSPSERLAMHARIEVDTDLGPKGTLGRIDSDGMHSFAVRRSDGVLRTAGEALRTGSRL